MSEILYFIQISCIFVGKSATFSDLLGDCSVGAYNPPSPVGVKGSVSAAESSLHVLGIFLHITAKRQNKTIRSRHSQCPGDVLRMVRGRFAGQEYSFAVSREYMALFCAL